MTVLFLCEKLHEVGNFRNESALETNGSLQIVQIDCTNRPVELGVSLGVIYLSPYNTKKVTEKLCALSRVAVRNGAEPGLKISCSGPNSKVFSNVIT